LETKDRDKTKVKKKGHKNQTEKGKTLIIQNIISTFSKKINIISMKHLCDEDMNH
jgi:hypothetical protein